MTWIANVRIISMYHRVSLQHSGFMSCTPYSQ